MPSVYSAAKILAYQGISVSGDTLLRMLKTAGEAHEVKVGAKIGVDDWAYRKGQEYGTIARGEHHESSRLSWGEDCAHAEHADEGAEAPPQFCQRQPRLCRQDF